MALDVLEDRSVPEERMAGDGDYLYMFAEADNGGVVLMHWIMLAGQGIGELRVFSRNGRDGALVEETVPDPEDPVHRLVVPIQIKENGDRLSVFFGPERPAPVLGRALLDGDQLAMTVLGDGVGTAKLTLHRGSMDEWTRMLTDYQVAVRAN
ncbi:MAG TPA: hypothetical protein VHW44_24995 [Pseudonocardiaceae bacterium]|jgi:hypothetical protein|nr:hypothetical protein [Pseudonocardiaceae bacterium]